MRSVWQYTPFFLNFLHFPGIPQKIGSDEKSHGYDLVYVFDNNNEQTWDTLFAECMALYLMHKLAKPITGSQSESDSAWQKLQNLLKQARAVNAQERPSQDFDANFSSSLIGVRY